MSFDFKPILSRLFDTLEVKEEWDVAHEAEDLFKRENPPRSYYPRIDYAAGPFNLDEGRRNLSQINNAYSQYNSFVDNLTQMDVFGSFRNTNTNPRCFIAVEVENQTGGKHRLGSMLKACAIGKVGIVVAGNNNRTQIKIERSLQSIRQYVVKITKAGKIPRNDERRLLDNLIILKESTFVNLINESITVRFRTNN